MKACKVELVVDGEVVHSMLADELYSTQDRKGMHVWARSWSPAVQDVSDNPFIGVPSMTPLDGIMSVAEVREREGL